MVKPIVLLDFDGTLYRKDSLITFHLFCLCKYPILIIWIPFQVICWLLHLGKLISSQQFKNVYMLFLSFRSVETIEEDAAAFWKQEFPRKFNLKLLELLHNPEENYVIITASPIVYIKPLLQLLPLITLIGTEVKDINGFYVIDGKNCKGKEKIVAFRKKFPHPTTITKAYSDNHTDKPMLELAQNAFLVNGDLITPYSS